MEAFFHSTGFWLGVLVFGCFIIWLGLAASDKQPKKRK